MPSEVAVTPKHLATVRTAVRLDVRVREEVRLEVGTLVEGSRAHRTAVRGALGVQDAVHGQRAGLAETFAALRAPERLLLRVDIPATTRSPHLFSHFHGT